MSLLRKVLTSYPKVNFGVNSKLNILKWFAGALGNVGEKGMLLQLLRLQIAK